MQLGMSLTAAGTTIFASLMNDLMRVRKTPGYFVTLGRVCVTEGLLRSLLMIVQLDIKLGSKTRHGPWWSIKSV